MSKKRESMIPGKRYRGYGYINEFKEFCFEPENTGSRAGAIKQICSRENVSVSETKSHILLHCKLPKQSEKLHMYVLLAKVYNTIIKIFKEYDI